MNVKKLKAILKNCPDDMQVFINQNNTEFVHSLVASATVEDISFFEHPKSKPLASDNVLVIKDEI